VFVNKIKLVQVCAHSWASLPTLFISAQRLSELPFPCVTMCHHISTALYHSLSVQRLSKHTVQIYLVYIARTNLFFCTLFITVRYWPSSAGYITTLFLHHQEWCGIRVAGPRPWPATQIPPQPTHTETPTHIEHKNTRPMWWFNRKVAGSWWWMY